MNFEGAEKEVVESDIALHLNATTMVSPPPSCQTPGDEDQFSANIDLRCSRK